MTGKLLHKRHPFLITQRIHFMTGKLVCKTSLPDYSEDSLHDRKPAYKTSFSDYSEDSLHDRKAGVQDTPS